MYVGFFIYRKKMEKKNYWKDLLFFIIKVIVFYLLSFLIISFLLRRFNTYYTTSKFFEPINKYIQHSIDQENQKIELDNQVNKMLF